MCHLSGMRIIRRVGLRKELKPFHIFGPSGSFSPDWLLIVREQGRQGFESFMLVFLCPDGAAHPWMRYETLMIAKGQAHAEMGIQYVEWEVCDIEILDPDNSVHWQRALPEGRKPPLGGDRFIETHAQRTEPNPVRGGR
jgi:hypothetical protein